ncbi:MAG TPA: hypothetical protein VH393_14395 [Ktedonobacterales bacterium]|jgi:hypothetical protein
MRRETPRHGKRLTKRLWLIPLLLLLLAVAGAAGCGAGPMGAATPTVDAAMAQRQLDTAARQEIAGYTQQVDTSYDAGKRAVQVQATVGWTPEIGIGDVEKAQERAKTICFLALRALWTSGVPLREATVTVLGPVQDDYGSQTTDAHAIAYLVARTSAGFTWGALTPDAAWGRYDRVWLRPNYQPNVVHPHNP